ncbi:MAG: hypothetical protein ACK481_08915 [Candidatus Melainabacteria bacterium]|jgi:hypothetical protein
MKGLFLETQDQSRTSAQEAYQNIALEDEIETEYFTSRNKLSRQNFNKGKSREAKNFFYNYSKRIYNLIIFGKINLDFLNLSTKNLLKKRSIQIILFVFFFSVLVIPNITDLSSLALIGISSNKSSIQNNINSIEWKSFKVDESGNYFIKRTSRTNEENDFNIYVPYSLIEHIDNSCIERENANAYIYNNGDKLIELKLESLQRGCEISFKDSGSIYQRNYRASKDSTNRLIIEKRA